MLAPAVDRDLFNKQIGIAEMRPRPEKGETGENAGYAFGPLKR